MTTALDERADTETAPRGPAPPRPEPEPAPERAPAPATAAPQVDEGADTGSVQAQLLALQSTAGNQAVAGMLAGGSGGAEPTAPTGPASGAAAAATADATATAGVDSERTEDTDGRTGDGGGGSGAPGPDRAAEEVEGAANVDGAAVAQQAGAGPEGAAEPAAQPGATGDVEREPTAVQGPVAADVSAPIPAEEIGQGAAAARQTLAQAAAGAAVGTPRPPAPEVGDRAEPPGPGAAVPESTTLTSDAAAARAVATDAAVESAAAVDGARQSATALATTGIGFAAETDPLRIEESAAAADLMSAFLAGLAERADAVLDGAAGVSGPIEAAGEQALAAVAAGADGQTQLVGDQIAQLRAEVAAEAQAARDLVGQRNDATLDSIRAATAATRATLQGEYDAAVQTVQQQMTDQLAALEEKYRAGDERFRETGRTVGADAQRRSAEMAAAYVAGVDVDDDDGFWDDEPVIRRAKARRDTAEGVGTAYHDGLIEQANGQADQALQGKARDIETIHTTAAQATESLTTQWAAIQVTLADAETAALGQAETARAGLITGIDQALDGSNLALTLQSQTLLASIAESAGAQELVLKQQVAQLTAQLQDQLAATADGLVQAGQELVAQLSGLPSPAVGELAASLTDATGRLDTAVEQARADADTGTADAAQRVADAGTQGVDGIATATQDGLAAAVASASEGATAIGSVAGSAAATFAGVEQSHESTLAGTATAASGGFAQVVTGVGDAYGRLNEGLERGFEQSAAGLEKGLRDAIPGMESDIRTKAEDNASRVPARWKDWLRWILIIAVVVLVALVIGPFVIGAVGAALGTGAVMTGIIAGAIVGGATSATIQAINNWAENRPIGEGVVRAGIIGAIGGAVGGGFGAWVGQLGQGGVAIASTSFRQFALNAGANIVTENAINLATGNLSWESFRNSVISAVVVGGALHAMSGLKPVSSLQERVMIGGGERVGGALRTGVGGGPVEINYRPLTPAEIATRQQGNGPADAPGPTDAAASGPQPAETTEPAAQHRDPASTDTAETASPSTDTEPVSPAADTPESASPAADAPDRAAQPADAADPASRPADPAERATAPAEPDTPASSGASPKRNLYEELTELEGQHRELVDRTAGGPPSPEQAAELEALRGRMRALEDEIRVADADHQARNPGSGEEAPGEEALAGLGEESTPADPATTARYDEVRNRLAGRLRDGRSASRVFAEGELVLDGNPVGDYSSGSGPRTGDPGNAGAVEPRHVLSGEGEARVPGQPAGETVPSDPAQRRAYEQQNRSDEGYHPGSRTDDAEAKILRAAQQDLGGNTDAAGELHIVVDEAPCPACRAAMHDFQGRYPNVRVVVHVVPR